MHTRILMALLVSLILPTATATAGGALPKYIVDDGIGFGIYANGDWRGVSGTLNPLVEKAAVDRGPAPSKDRSFMIWTKTCRPGQFAAFERTVEFLGRPLVLGGFTQTGLDVKTWDIYINDKKVAHLLKRVQPTFTLAHRKLLKFGDNTIRVEVQLSNAANACTEDTRPGRRGVWFSFFGNNVADLTVTKPPRKTVFEHGQSYLQPITVTNRGRALATNAVLSISMASHVACLKFNPDNTCKDWMFDVKIWVTDVHCNRVAGVDPHDKRFLECQIEDVSPGKSRDLQVLMEFDRNPGAPDWVMQENILTWEVKTSPGAVGDSNLANNKGEVHVKYCQYGVGAGRCKAKP